MPSRIADGFFARKFVSPVVRLSPEEREISDLFDGLCLSARTSDEKNKSDPSNPILILIMNERMIVCASDHTSHVMVVSTDVISDKVADDMSAGLSRAIGTEAVVADVGADDLRKRGWALFEHGHYPLSDATRSRLRDLAASLDLPITDIRQAGGGHTTTGIQIADVQKSDQETGVVDEGMSAVDSMPPRTTALERAPESRYERAQPASPDPTLPDPASPPSTIKVALSPAPPAMPPSETPISVMRVDRLPSFLSNIAAIPEAKALSDQSRSDSTLAHNGRGERDEVENNVSVLSDDALSEAIAHAVDVTVARVHVPQTDAQTMRRNLRAVRNMIAECSRDGAIQILGCGSNDNLGHGPDCGGAVEMTADAILETGGILPAILLHAFIIWMPVALSQPESGFSLRLKTDSTAWLGYRLVALNCSSVMYLTLAISEAIEACQQSDGAGGEVFNLTKSVEVCRKWLAGHGYDTSSIDTLFG